jgi:ADP-heptose:LPS heptosyltransferase
MVCGGGRKEMRIIMPDKLIKADSYYFKPFCRYIVSDYELDTLLKFSPRTNWKWSSFNAWERRYSGQDLNGKKVCVYRHNAWGDQLIASAIPRYIKTLYPDATVHLYCHPHVMALWLGNPYVEGSAISLPIPFEAAINYDYQVFYEGMLEGNSEPDQRCCYDDMFGWIGLDDVPTCYKRPCFFPRPEDYKYVKKSGIDLKKKYMVYHMAPDNENRSYPPKKSKLFIEKFLAAFPVFNVIIVGMDKHKEYEEILEVFRYDERVVNLIDKTPNFRDVFPIIERASLVICPDSAVMHMAAIFDQVPVISLWGLFAPHDRIAYYPNNFPLFHPEACPHAPCRDHNFFLPLENCKDATEHRDKERIKWCCALDAITPEEIVERAKGILG